MNKFKSPNFDLRSGGVKYLIMHYTGMASGKEALDRLCDEDAAVSAHYLIEENGQVYSLVDEHKRAWHAGVSIWEGHEDINDLSIGIEIVNTGHPYPGYESVYQEFPDLQMKAVISLAKDIMARHKIKPWDVIGHSDVAWRRKIDPGELFDWKGLALEGIGIWPDKTQSHTHFEINSADFLKKAKLYGYDIEGCHKSPEALVSAFQRHFRQSNFDGALDQETVLILENLLAKKFS